jgi:hypothetical protein
MAGDDDFVDARPREGLEEQLMISLDPLPSTTFSRWSPKLSAMALRR